MGPQELTCGNVNYPAQRWPKFTASMGPQELTCGNLWRDISNPWAKACFNGAAGINLRKS